MKPTNLSFDVIAQLASLRRYARSLVRNPADAEDLVQDALLRAYERRQTFRSGGSLRTWLLSIVHNVHIDRRRSRLTTERREATVASETDTVYPATQEQSVYLRQVREAFMMLPDEQREALHLIAVEDLSYQEAADALQIPVGTLMSRVSRARAKLRAGDAPEKLAPHLKIVGGGHE